jgi:methionyl-tRNA synthetase
MGRKNQERSDGDVKSFFITTAIDYTNAAPHIGHAYEKILADVIARYHRLTGEPTFFLTGVDQHGQKVQQAAQMQGIAPQEFVDGITEKFRALWKKLEIGYTEWAATTDPRHKECVRKILTRLNNEGQIYKDKRGGYYSVRQEQFLTDKERGPDGEFGPEWGHVEFREEENYYFRLAEHKQWLLELIDTRTVAGRPLVVPEFRMAELRNAVEKLEGDLCISRPKARLAWGIEFPFDTEFVTYVWFDALVNYISFAPGYDPGPGADLAEFHRWWPPTHVIGKDILIPAHGVYWPIMLKALGFPNDKIPPLLVHGWWNISGAKMSKSLGNIVNPDALADKYGAEALRYYLMSDIATGKDSDFSEERLIQRYNTDLANNLGNLLNRTLSMAWKYRNGRITSGSYDDEMTADIRGKGQAQLTQEAFPHCMEEFELDTALSLVRAYCGLCNELVEKSAPWKLAKEPEQADRLSAVLYHLAEALRIIAILLSPVLPNAAVGIFAQLNWDRAFALADAKWGGLPNGHLLGKPTPLFPRIETEAGVGSPTRSSNSTGD